MKTALEEMFELAIAKNGQFGSVDEYKNQLIAKSDKPLRRSEGKSKNFSKLYGKKSKKSFDRRAKVN